MDRPKFELAIDRKLEHSNQGPVKFEYQYLALRIAYIFVATGEVHGKRVAHYGYLPDDDIEAIEEWIDAIQVDFFQPGRLDFVLLGKKLPGALLEDAEHVRSTNDGFRVICPARPSEE